MGRTGKTEEKKWPTTVLPLICIRLLCQLIVILVIVIHIQYSKSDKPEAGNLTPLLRDKKYLDKCLSWKKNWNAWEIPTERGL